MLEAGSKGNALLEAPVFGPFFHGSVFDWQFETVPQKYACFAMKDKVSKIQYDVFKLNIEKASIKYVTSLLI